MKYIKVLICFMLFLLIGTAGASIHREPLSSIGVQGMISGSDIPAEGNVTKDITFKIYNRKTGGSVLWSGTYSVVIANRLFNVILGTTNPDNPIDINWNLNDRYYLGMQVVGGGSELSPRQELVAVPFAMLARETLSAEVSVNYDGGKISAVADGRGRDIPGSFKATATEEVSKALYARAECFGVEGNAWGGLGRGVGGKAYQKGTGVRGENLYNGTDTLGPDQAIGVKGKSNVGHGVYGKNEDVDNVEGISGIGDPGIEGHYRGGTNYGKIAGSDPRRLFKYTIGSDGSVGSYAENGTRTYGVYGELDADTYGILMLEEWSDSISHSYGVYGYTQSGYAGVKGESPNGIGVEGFPVIAVNTNPGAGPALEVGKGWIKIPSEVSDANALVLINSPMGVIQNRSSSNRTVQVNNELVGSKSIVFADKYRSRVWNINDPPGSFKIYLEAGEEVGFLVIN